MSKGKILLVANTEWYLYNFRLSLAQFLRDQGWEVVLVSPFGDYVEGIRANDFRWVEWNIGRQTVVPIFELQSIRSLQKIYQQEQPTLVHHFTVKPVLYGSLAARFARVPAIVNSITGLGYVFLQNSIRAKLLRGVVLFLYRQAFHHLNRDIIFENIGDRDFFIQQKLILPSEGNVIQGVGVDVKRFHPLSEPEGTPLVVFPARMLLDKGLGVLVESARLLHSRLSIRIALVGSPDPGNPATVTEHDLLTWEKEGIVEWWGFQQDMVSVYQNCHIVTLPSMGEGLPTVLIEAAACARPIVTTDVPGCRDVVTDGVNGLLVPPNDPEKLASAIERLASDPVLRAHMGAAGRQRVMENFTDQQVNQKTLAVYQHLLSIGYR